MYNIPYLPFTDKPILMMKSGEVCKFSKNFEKKMSSFSFASNAWRTLWEYFMETADASNLVK
jgi:hypothetical protein